MLIGVKAILPKTGKVGQIIMHTGKEISCETLLDSHDRFLRRYFLGTFWRSDQPHSQRDPPMLRASRVLSWKRLRRAKVISDTYLEFMRIFFLAAREAARVSMED